MTGVILLLGMSLVAGGFLASRVYLLISKGELNVKGAVYSRRDTPLRYGLVLATAIIGAALMLFIAGVLLLGFAAGSL